MTKKGKYPKYPDIRWVRAKDVPFGNGSTYACSECESGEYSEDTWVLIAEIESDSVNNLVPYMMAFSCDEHKDMIDHKFVKACGGYTVEEQVKLEKEIERLSRLHEKIPAATQEELDYRQQRIYELEQQLQAASIRLERVEKQQRAPVSLRDAIGGNPVQVSIVYGDD